MRYRRPFSILCLLFLSMPACERAWNSANRTPLEKDVRSLLKSCGPDPVQLKCGMAGTTREAWAAFNATPTQVNVLVKCLKLEVAEEGSDLRRVASYKESSFPAPEVVSVGAQWAEVWGTTRRVGLKSGSAFSYLILIFDSTTGRAGFRMAYAYG
jgi:hypothetical protein